jgi:hypothetical protein
VTTTGAETTRCPRCGATGRSFTPPDRAQCTAIVGVRTIPAHTTGGPGLTNPMAGPGILHWPQRAVSVVCGRTYKVPYDGLTSEEREAVDKAFVDQEVDDRLPVIVRRRHPGREPGFDVVPLAGFTVYWLVPTVILLLAFPPGALLTTVAFAGGVIRWWNAQTKPRTEWRESLRAHEKSQQEATKRDEAREALRAGLARGRLDAQAHS